MGAKVGEASNDTDTIKKAMDDLTAVLKDFDASFADIKKQMAQITKNPDECKKPAEQLMGELLGVGKTAKDFDPIVKKLQKAITK